MKLSQVITTFLLFGLISYTSGQINVINALSETKHQVYFAGYSPDGKYIATSGSDNLILLWGARTGFIYRTLVGSKKRPNQVAFSPDGSIIYSAGEDGLINIWDPAKLELSGSVSGHSGAIKALAISPDGKYLASGGSDKLLRIWSVSGNQIQLVFELKGHRKTITSLSFSPDSKSLVSVGADNFLLGWNVNTGYRQSEFKAHDAWIRCVKFSPDGKFIATGADDNLVKIWNSADMSLFETLEGHTDWVLTLDFTPSGKFLLSGGHDRVIIAWDLEKGTVAGRSFKMEHYIISLNVSPLGGNFVSSCLLSEDLRIWAYGMEAVIPDANGEKLAESSDNLPELSENPPVTLDEPAEEQVETGISFEGPAITLFSPEPINNLVVHDKPSILIIGKADGGGGVQTLLINKERVDISGSGIFQLDYALNTGENPIDVVAVSYKGKMSRRTFSIICTADNAVRSADAKPGAFDGTYYALIIGVNDYADQQIVDLDYPINDADSLYHTLTTQYIFQQKNVSLLRNPTRTEIITALDELSQEVTSEDNLLIFYAGHGHWEEKTSVGYWLPTDADRRNTANWFRNSTLRDFIGSIRSKHTLLIADACFSGSIFKTRSAFAEEVSGVRKLYDLSSRKAMTSGYLKEVPDKSVFVKYLIKGLNENSEKYLPSEELYRGFKSAVVNNSPNVPQYGTIQNVGDEGGDFIFVRK